MDTPSDLLFTGAWVDRFFSRIVVTGDCWLWTGYLDKDGYGKCGAMTDYSLPYRYTGQYKSHRLAWTLKFGRIPDGLGVLHKCDVRNCIMFDHLFLGTSIQNTQDRHNKGRSAKGETVPTSKLTEEIVIKMRLDGKPVDVTYREIGEKYGITKDMARFILTRKNWKHV